jgi:hypothetical protein
VARVRRRRTQTHSHSADQIRREGRQPPGIPPQQIPVSLDVGSAGFPAHEGLQTRRPEQSVRQRKLRQVTGRHPACGAQEPRHRDRHQPPRPRHHVPANRRRDGAASPPSRTPRSTPLAAPSGATALARSLRHPVRSVRSLASQPHCHGLPFLQYPVGEARPPPRPSPNHGWGGKGPVAPSPRPIPILSRSSRRTRNTLRLLLGENSLRLQGLMDTTVDVCGASAAPEYLSVVA